jgi:hypothetical protein
MAAEVQLPAVGTHMSILNRRLSPSVASARHGMRIGLVTALLGTWLAQNWWAYRRRIEWIEIVFQVGLAAIAIAFFAGVGRRRRV